MMRTLIAGFGNELSGDDGFGVAVVRRLRAEPLGDNVVLLDVGTGGLRMAQELLARYDRLIVVDAMDRGDGAAPGTLSVLQVDDVPRAAAVDAHLTLPANALAVARAMNVLPPLVYMVGVQPTLSTLEELTTDMSAPVRAAVGEAVRRIRSLLAQIPTAELQPHV